MKALTLRQPWAYAVSHLGKRIENRTWDPPASLLGQRIAIHAGRAYDDEGAAWIGEAIGRYAPRAALPLGAIVATATLAGVVSASDDPWFAGPVGWVLDDVQRLVRAVPCRGQQGLWSVPERVLAMVLDADTVDASRPCPHENRGETVRGAPICLDCREWLPIGGSP